MFTSKELMLELGSQLVELDSFKEHNCRSNRGTTKMQGTAPIAGL
jgi:hypothetical protein